MRLHRRKATHEAAKAVALVSLAVVVGVYLSDGSALDDDAYYYATFAAYVGGGGFLFAYANVEVLAALAEISYHPHYRSYEGSEAAFEYLRRSDALFNDWRYLVNEYHGGAVFAFWIGGTFLLLGGFLGLVEGSVPFAVVSLLSMGFGTTGIVAGSFVGWTRSVAGGIEDEADDPVRVDEIVKKARENLLR